jgi:hypothetical protein
MTAHAGIGLDWLRLAWIGMACGTREAFDFVSVRKERRVGPGVIIFGESPIRSRCRRLGDRRERDATTDTWQRWGRNKNENQRPLSTAYLHHNSFKNYPLPHVAPLIWRATISVHPSRADAEVTVRMRICGENPSQESVFSMKFTKTITIRRALGSHHYQTANYNEFVLVKDTPVNRVVGLSKLARLADTCVTRLQTQQCFTAQIAAAIK